MYDVAEFVKPVPYNPERNGECMQGEAQSLEYFRYARNQSFMAELIRERFSTPNVEGQATPACGRSPGP